MWDLCATVGLQQLVVLRRQGLAQVCAGRVGFAQAGLGLRRQGWVCAGRVGFAKTGFAQG